MFEKVKKFYDMGLYNKAQVKAFYLKGKITLAEYNEIVVDANINMNVVNASN